MVWKVESLEAVRPPGKQVLGLNLEEGGWNGGRSKTRASQWRHRQEGAGCKLWNKLSVHQQMNG